MKIQSGLLLAAGFPFFFALGFLNGVHLLGVYIMRFVFRKKMVALLGTRAQDV